ncbi:MAG: hypothetical protein AAB482_00555 [Patescibacteria group bacterium]
MAAKKFPFKVDSQIKRYISEILAHRRMYELLSPKELATHELDLELYKHPEHPTTQPSENGKLFFEYLEKKGIISKPYYQDERGYSSGPASIIVYKSKASFNLLNDVKIAQIGDIISPQKHSYKAGRLITQDSEGNFCYGRDKRIFLEKDNHLYYYVFLAIFVLSKECGSVKYNRIIDFVKKHFKNPKRTRPLTEKSIQNTINNSIKEMLPETATVNGDEILKALDGVGIEFKNPFIS